MGTFGPIHWLIVLVVFGGCLAAPMAAVVLAMILLRNGPSSPNLVPCPDCRRRVSRLAAACPHCGRPLSPVS
jgi:predicted amidophosphoribosyltransferase